MKAMVYQGDGKIEMADKPKPELKDAEDAIVKVVYTTICGTDLHILHGAVPSCEAGRTLGHEGVGVVEAIGDGVKQYKVGDRVLISCISSCATCYYCRRGMYSHCEKGGWVLGHTVDGTQAEYVRIPLADSSLHPVPKGVDEKELVMFSDILPTGNECGAINGQVAPGKNVAIIGAGPVGLAAMLTSKLHSPAKIISIDKDVSRLGVAKKLGAHETIEAGDDAAVTKKVMELTDGRGADTVIEAVGFPATIELAQDLVAPGGNIANIGVHGADSKLKISKLWGHNITLTTRLVDTVTTPTLLKLLSSGGVQAKDLITHEYEFSKMDDAYSTFKAAAQHSALKMLITM